MSEMATPDVGEVADAYMRFTSPDGVSYSSRDQNFVYTAATELLGDDALEAYAFVELENDPYALLIVAGKGVALLALRGDVVEARFLGPLQGTYREEWAFDDEVGPRLSMIFEDTRLPGGRLAMETEAPPHRRAFPDRRADRTREMLLKIRGHLREWAVSYGCSLGAGQHRQVLDAIPRHSAYRSARDHRHDCGGAARGARARP